MTEALIVPCRLRLPPQRVELVQHLAGFVGKMVAAKPARLATGVTSLTFAGWPQMAQEWVANDRVLAGLRRG